MLPGKNRCGGRVRGNRTFCVAAICAREHGGDRRKNLRARALGRPFRGVDNSVGPDGLFFPSVPFFVPCLPPSSLLSQEPPSPSPAAPLLPNAGFALGMTGMLPFSICVFGFDTVYSPAFPTINLVGCPLGLTVSPTLLLFLATTDAAGTATFPISLLGVPVGVTLYNQGFTFCSADPTGFVFSPFQSLTIGGL